ncbi:response regulator [Phycicoccus flavus]|uniref:response regulator n=1 Tax=Phycicoccus flavus TaxID=2502783 RepID=UPI000FEBBABA|nr:response regulator transcription factor [Phycicoccus flavus]NHA67002.1 response regulator transcription factor [Phycicoccus flavus]
MIRVLIVDDHSTIRAGLRLILSDAQDVVVVGEAADGDAAVHNARALSPDVVLMDVRMPRTDGVEATRRLRAEGYRVLVLTTYDHDEVVYGAIRAGAAGFLLKTAESSELVAAVRRVAAGDGALAPEVTGRVLARLTETADAAAQGRADRSGLERLEQAGLTSREVEVLAHIGHGRSNIAISRRLDISLGTTKTHVSRILMKLGLESRTQAALIARDSGLGADG